MAVQAKVRQFKKGEIIFQEGEESEQIYIILEGIAEVVKMNSSDEEILIATVQKDEVFGELGVIQDRKRQACVRAKTDVLVKEFDTSLFDSLFDMEIGKELLPIIQTMAERIRVQSSKLTELNYRIKEEKPQIIRKSNSAVQLVAVTKKAKAALNGLEMLDIHKFPFKVGRNTDKRKDKFFHKNDLYLTDKKPYKISRNHFSLIKEHNDYYFSDENSKLGSTVNGKKTGNHHGRKKVLLNPGENGVCLGPKSDKICFIINIDADELK
jgi:CRP-like cAMP-binding protein